MEKIEFKNNSEPYLSAENLNQMQENAEVYIDSNIEKIKNELEEYKKISYTLANTVRGESITINDAIECKLLSLEIDGKSVQETRSGKNLLILPIENNVTVTDVGINRTTSLSSIKLNGTVTANGDAIRQKIGTFKAGTYTYSHLMNNKFTLSNTSGSAFAYYIKKVNTKESVVEVATNLTNYNLSYNKTFTLTEDTELYLQMYLNGQSVGTVFNDYNINFQIEEGSTATEWEQGGVSPSPDYPSEIESVGYENLFPLPETETKNGVTFTKNADGSFNIQGTATENTEFLVWMDYKDCKLNLMSEKKYFLSHNIRNNSNVKFQISTWNGVVGSATWVNTQYQGTSSGVLTSGYTNVGALIRFCVSVNKGISVDLTNVKVQLEEGITSNSFVPFGKYGIEVKTVGKNLFNNIMESGNINSSGVNYNDGNSIRSVDFIKVQPVKEYIISNNGIGIQYNLSEYDENQAFIRKTFLNGKSIITSSNTKYIKFQTSVVTNYNFQLEEGPIATEYEPYQEQTILIALNKPLRSLPNGTKDIAYIKNNKLYVDRYVGRIVLDGTESIWTKTNEGFYTPSHSWGNKSKAETLSNYFQTFTNYNSGFQQATNGAGFLYSNVYQYYLKIDGITTVEELKTWLSTHNTEVFYELATPITEEVDDYVIINTYAGVNNIDLEANLETEFSVTYFQNIKILLQNYPTNEEMKNYVNSILGTISS